MTHNQMKIMDYILTERSDISNIMIEQSLNC